MRALINRNASHPQRTENNNRAETVVATIWLVFYVLALGVAITSPLISRALEIAAR